MGIYNGSAARTLQLNIADRIHYLVGADVVVIESWVPPDVEDQKVIRRREDPRPVATSEPPWFVRAEIPGVKAIARVFYRRAEGRRGSEQLGSLNILALTPSEFLHTAWQRDDLMSRPFTDYLSALARHREGVLVSEDLASSKDLIPGDVFRIEYQLSLIHI